MIRSLRRWWRRRQGVPFEIIYAMGNGQPGKMTLAIEVDGDYETWRLVSECRRLKP
jgi:hypothetical protein